MKAPPPPSPPLELFSCGWFNTRLGVISPRILKLALRRSGVGESTGIFVVVAVAGFCGANMSALMVEFEAFKSVEVKQ